MLSSILGMQYILLPPTHYSQLTSLEGVSLQSLYFLSLAAPLDTSQLELIDSPLIESHNSPHVRVTCRLNTKTLPSFLNFTFSVY